MLPEEKDKILAEVLKKSQYNLSSLPNLDENDSWMKQIFNNIMKNISSWLSHLKLGDGFHWKLPDLTSLASAMSYLSILLIALILGYIAYQVYRYYQFNNSSNTTISLLNEQVTTPKEDLTKLLNALIENHKYKEALRVRWIIFLTNIKRHTSLTPIDLSQSIGTNLNFLYKPMFSNHSLNANELNSYFSTLTELEKGANSQ